MQDPNERRVIQEEVVQTPLGAEATVVDNRVSVLPTPAEQQLGTLERARQVVWFIVALILVAIGLRFALLALAANPANGFVTFIYGISGLFVGPFRGMFGGEPQAGGSVFETADLIAMLVYLLLGWIINRALALVLAPKTTTTTY